jgi:hypothetical protein
MSLFTTLEKQFSTAMSTKKIFIIFVASKNFVKPTISTQKTFSTIVKSHQNSLMLFVSFIQITPSFGACLNKKLPFVSLFCPWTSDAHHVFSASLVSAVP